MVEKYFVSTVKDKMIRLLRKKKILFRLLCPAKHCSWNTSKYCRKSTGQNSIVFSGLVKKCTTELHGQAHCIWIPEPHISNRSHFFQRKGESLCSFPARKEIVMQARQALRAEEKCATVQKATVSLLFSLSHTSFYYSHETYANRRISNWVSLELPEIRLT